MSKYKSNIAAMMSIAAILHIQIAQAAFAETSAEMAAAAAQANTSAFKANPADLYSNRQNKLQITGVTTNDGALSLSPSDLYFGITGQTAKDGALPQISDYEQLYGYRDTEIGKLEAGTGSFNSTGDLNAEASAFEVLRGTRNTPSISAENFLLRSREILADGSEDTAEFGQCVIQQVTGSTTYEYDDTVIESCDTSAVDVSPMEAQRIYRGPSHIFKYVKVGAQGYCEFGGKRIKTDAPATCGKLSILEAIPTSKDGVISARACSVKKGCVEILLQQNGYRDAVSLNFTVDPAVTLTRASVNGNTGQNGFAAHQGTRISLSNGAAEIPSVLSTKGQLQVVAVSEGVTVTRLPPTGFLYSNNVTYWHTELNNSRAVHINWGGQQVNLRTERISVTATVFEASDGCTYFRGPKQSQHYFNLYYQIARECVDDAGYATLTTRLEFNETLFTSWQFNAARWNEIKAAVADGTVTLRYNVLQTAARPNGCVFAYLGSNGQAGELCGSDIPVAPFNGIPDRAATRVAIIPTVGVIVDDQNGDEAFVTTNACQPLIGDPHCSFIGRECVDRSAGGTCTVYENRYSCGQTITYTSPIVEEINICNSDLSCLGDDCILNAGTDGSTDLADAASKLAALDMILTDMQCEVEPSSSTAENDMSSCQLFTGERQTCSRVTLGLSNCCTNAKGVNLTDYLQLAFSVSRVSRVVEGTTLANPITSSWVSFEDLGRDSFSKLTRPITESWDSIIGNTGAARGGANAFSMEAVKQSMMKNAAQWTADVFGEQAANALFNVTAGGVSGPAVSGGVVNSGTIGLSTSAASVMSAVMTAYSIYALASALIEILFACSKDEQELMVRRSLKSTHEVGTYCSRKILGKCVKRKTMHCMFNSPLSRIMNEQARLQLNLSWGSPNNPNCRGITLAEFQRLDMEKVDLTEWTGMLVTAGMVDVEGAMDIEALTGTGSTLGLAQQDLYERENAIERNLNRVDGMDLDALRRDAVTDFGMGTVQ